MGTTKDDHEERLLRIQALLNELNGEVATLREERRVTSEELASYSKVMAQRAQAAAAQTESARTRASARSARTEARLRRKPKA